MELRQEGKQLETSVIPSGWTKTRLDQIADIRSGGTPSTGNPDFWNGGVPWCTPTDITALGGRKYLTETERTISQEGLRCSSAEVIPSNSIIMTSRATIGECAINTVPMTTNQGFKNLIPSTTDCEFLYYLMTTQKERLIQLCGGSTFLEVGKKQLLGFEVILPNEIDEQHTIATALSDVDALLEGLDRLIAKKRDLKQAAMQQLLTGETRLPGYTGEWEEKRVFELGEVVTGGTPKTSVAEYWGGEYPWVTPTDISTCRDMSTSERCLTREGVEAIRSLPPNSVLVTCIASIGKNAILKVPGACNQQINAVIPNQNNNPVFLYYMFEASKSLLLANAGITATSIISKAAFSELSFRIPLYNEQTEIAEVLSDMDAEIAALEQRRAKTADLKQAMMQELLTGRTRLA